MARRVQTNKLILSADEIALTEGALARYNKTNVGLNPFTFSAGSKSRSIENAVLARYESVILCKV